MLPTQLGLACRKKRMMMVRYGLNAADQLEMCSYVTFVTSTQSCIHIMLFSGCVQFTEFYAKNILIFDYRLCNKLEIIMLLYLMCCLNITFNMKTFIPVYLHNIDQTSKTECKYYTLLNIC